MKAGISLPALAAQIQARAEAKKDYVAPASKMQLAVPLQAVIPDAATPAAESPKDRRVELVLQNGHNNHLAVNAVAHAQLAEYAGIPKPYYDRMLQDAPHLLAANVNRWLEEHAAKEKTDRRMVRTLNGTARAVLSDKYRPLENEDLAEAILPTLLEADLLIMSCQITDTRLYIKAVDKRIEKDVPTGRKMGDGSHVFFDTCSPAIIISNSEVGHGALSIETGVYTSACTNLAMIGSNMRKSHVGRRSELSDDVYALLTDATRRTTDAAVWMQVRDVVKASFDRARFDAVCGKLVTAAAEKLGDDPVQLIERVGRRFGLVEGERKGILSRLIEGGDLTRYGLHSAITRHSADVEDYDRATELERLGGQVIELARTDWSTIVKAAA